MTHLSIIIPVLGPQQILDETLVSVLENRPEGCEVLLVRPQSYVDPYDLGDEVRFVESEQTDVVSMLNVGMDACRGSVLHLLSPGVTVGPGWCDAALDLFDGNRNVGSVSPCIVANGMRRTVLGVEYNARTGKQIVRSSKRPILAPLLGTGFYQASALRFMRGFDATFGDCADVELGLRMKSASYKAVKCDSRIHSQKKMTFQPARGFAGGKLRGQLSRSACELGLSSSLQGWLGFFGETVTNGFGPGMIGALLGRLSSRPVGQRRPGSTDVIPVDPTRKTGRRIKRNVA